MSTGLMAEWLDADAWAAWASNPHNQETAKTLLVSGVAWTALEVLSHLLLTSWFLRLLDGNPAYAAAGEAGKPKKVATARQAMPRVVCFIHNAIQVPLGLVILLDPAFQADPVFFSTPLSRTMVAISAGYFLYDTLECVVRYDHEGPEFLMHGVFCFAVYALLLHLGILNWFGAGFLMWEMSTPFLHLRWFLYKIGRDDTTVYTAVCILGLATFFGCRNVWGIYLSVRYWLATAAALATPEGRAALPVGVILFFRVALFALNGLNLYWVSQMLRILIKTVREAWGKGSMGKREAASRKQALKVLKSA